MLATAAMLPLACSPEPADLDKPEGPMPPTQEEPNPDPEPEDPTPDPDPDPDPEPLPQVGRPNIVLIIVDDMGFSDLGCYGSEIPTPNIDRLAQSGVRYTQFYSTARSCPTRASLMTGLYPHQAGIGKMTEDYGSVYSTNPSYQGFLNKNCVTIAEVLKKAGYHTYMTGKWHLGINEQDRWPLQRGFDEFYGILGGACSYLDPFTVGKLGQRITYGNIQPKKPAGSYYTTDAFTDYALQFLESSKSDDAPYFLYLSYNGVHWPLHAKETDISKFAGVYDKGWQEIQAARHKRMIDMGIVDESWGLAEWEMKQWSEVPAENRAKLAYRMQVYAAQLHCIDYNVGRVLDWIEQSGERDNTIIMFLSDNGGCAENYSMNGSGSIDDINNPSKINVSYGLPWAQVSNTPFRKYKVRAYEGGLSVPLIFSWPEQYSQYSGQLRQNVAFLPDIMATILDATDAEYPTIYKGNTIKPHSGSSILPTLDNPNQSIHDYIYGEHFDNRYVRHGDWKAVWDQNTKAWELYNIPQDRTERNNLAKKHPDIINGLIAQWTAWANSYGVYPK